MNRSTSLLWLALLVGGLLFGGCAAFDDGALPTLIPTEYVPTAIALTAQALAPPPTATSGGSAAQETFTPSPTPTPTPRITQPPPSPTPIPLIPAADIQIVRPAPLSKVVSPMSLVVYLYPGFGRRATVDLYGEDRRLIYRKVFSFTSPNERVSIVREVGFEVAGAGEVGYLVVETKDEYGRVIARATSEIILLAEGQEDANIATDVLAPIVIQQPPPEVLIQGGTLHVSGLARTAGERPLLVELIAPDGRVVGWRLAGVLPTETGEHHPFEVDIPYRVNEPTWVRLTVSERGGGNLPGALNIASVLVLLSP